MSRILSFRYNMLIVMSAITMQACGLIYEDNECPDGKMAEFEIVADWKYAPEASPEGMAYLFFPENGDRPWRFDFPGKYGGKINLPSGRYRVLVFNDDTTRLMLSGADDFSLLEFLCMPGGAFDGLGTFGGMGQGPAEVDGQSVYRQPDMLYTDVVEGFILSEGGVTVDSGNSMITNRQRRLTVYPRLHTARYKAIFENVENMKDVARMCCTLNGMSASFNVANSVGGASPSVVPFSCSSSGPTVIEGEMLTFGRCMSAENKLTLYIWLRDGSKYSFIYDVTDQIINANDPMRVTLIIKGVDIPESKGDNVGAFDISVGGWTEIEIFYYS